MERRPPGDLLQAVRPRQDRADRPPVPARRTARLQLLDLKRPWDVRLAERRERRPGQVLRPLAAWARLPPEVRARLRRAAPGLLRRREPARKALSQRRAGE